MKIKNGFTLNNVCGEYVLLAEGKDNIDFSSIIHFNETAAYLWEKMQGRDFEAEDMAKSLMEEYDVDESTALSDCREVLAKWQETGIIG